MNIKKENNNKLPQKIMKIFQAFKCTIHRFINSNLKREFTIMAYGQFPVRSLKTPTLHRSPWQRGILTGWHPYQPEGRVTDAPLKSSADTQVFFSSSFFSNPDSYVSQDVSLTVSAVLTDGQCLVSKSRESNSDSGNGAAHLWTRIQLTIIGL